MSEFVPCETKFKDQKALVEGLVAMGWDIKEIEVHKEPQHLYGYCNDKRPEKANIIIRRQHVGGSSNDIGFLKKADGTYEAIISEFDRGSGGRHAKHTNGYNEKWLKQLSMQYGEKLIIRQAKAKGIQIRRVEKMVDGKKVVTLIGSK